MPRTPSSLEQAGSRQIPIYPVTNILLNSTSVRQLGNFACILGSRAVFPYPRTILISLT